MWDAIRANRRRSTALIVALAAVLVVFGYAIGGALDPSLAPLGALGALAVWGVMMLTALGGGEKLLLAQAGAVRVEKKDAPQLVNIVEEMSVAAGLSQPPRVYIVDDPSPNAFAVGLNEKRAAVAVNTGLLATLSRDELQGVVAHEVGHIANRDTLFMTLAGATMGAVVMLADLYLRGLRFGGYRGRVRGSKGSQGAAFFMILALVLAILAPLLAQLLYFACSRRREFLADASAAQFTRFPEGLASALEKISGARPAEPRDVSRVLAPMYIVEPQAFNSLFATHPPAAERIRILRGMRSDSSLVAYERSYRELHGDRGVIGSRSLRGLEMVAARAPAGAAEPAAVSWRDAKDILHRVNGTTAIDCPCGLRLKLPPAFDAPSVVCPRCGAAHACATA
jgi:heat shock protein HtpX